MSNHLARYFTHLAENLRLIATEMETGLDAIRTLEIIPGISQDWWVHINDERFVQIQRNSLGECQVIFRAWYSDFFEDVIRPERKRP